MSKKPQPSEEIPNLPTRIKGEILPPAPDPMTVAKLTIVKGNEEGNEFFVKKGVTGLGRAADNEIALTDLSCSRKHVQLVWEDDSLVLADLGSGNGTLLNKHRITREVLRNNDVFEIGNTQLKVELYAPFEEAMAPRAPARVPEPIKKPASPVAQNQTVGLPGLREQDVKQGLVGGVLPPTASGAQKLPGPFGGGKPTMAEEAAPAPAPRPAPAAPAPMPSAPQALVPAPSFAAPEVSPAASANQGGVLSRLSAVGQARGKNWVYALAGGNALALLTGAALLLWNPSANASGAGVTRFQEGLAAYAKMDWPAAQTAFTEALTLSPALTEASDYLRMTQNEQANAGRLTTAKELMLLSSDAKTSVVVLSLALSVPMESVSGGDAKKLAYQAKQALSMSTKASVEEKLQQNTPMSFQAAAFELKQAEAAFGGQLPMNLTEPAERLQKASMKSDWHELTMQPAMAMADPMPTPAAMPETPPEPAVNPEPMKTMEPEPVKPEPVAMKPEPMVMKPEPAKPEPKPEPAVVSKPDPKPTATPTAKAEPTKLDEKAARANAQALYKEGKFEKAAVEAKKNKKTEPLAKQIEEFSSKYASVKSKFASGERATIYDSAKRALSLDSSIASAYQTEIKAWIGPCADARARQLYNTASAAKPTNYGLFKDAYVVALEANRYGVKKESGPIIKAIDDDVAKKKANAANAEKKGKTTEAITLYDIITQYVPSSTQAYNDAKKASDRLKGQQGGL
jgi:pSer/pThr/pTyr-binding forkhead associated (FHA) protein